MKKLMFLAAVLTAAGCGPFPEAEPIQKYDDTGLRSVRRGLYVASGDVWASPDIPFCWETAGLDVEKGWVRAALRDSWEAVSSVRFTGFGQCVQGSTGLRVRLQNSGGFTTGLGTDLNGVVNGVNLNTWGTATTPVACATGFTREECVRSTAVHELGHALGFAHEQNRPNTPTACTQPAQGADGDTTVGDWDWASVMNYCNTIRNGRGILSLGDVQGVTQFYGTNGRWVDSRVFDAGVYLTLHPDLRAAYGNDLNSAREHWLARGLPHEGRRGSRGFDVGFYLRAHPDLSAAYGTRYWEAVHHWTAQGLPNEARRGSRELDVQFYKSFYPDIQAAYGSDHGAAFDHWIAQGLPNEARRGALEFDVQYYKATYPDIQAAFGSDHGAALDHFAGQGLPNEGRRGSQAFHVTYYINTYPDLSGSTNIAAFEHWVMTGRNEGRQGAP